MIADKRIKIKEPFYISEGFKGAYLKDRILYDYTAFELEEPIKRDKYFQVAKIQY